MQAQQPVGVHTGVKPNHRTWRARCAAPPLLAGLLLAADAAVARALPGTRDGEGCRERAVQAPRPTWLETCSFKIREMSPGPAQVSADPV